MLSIFQCGMALLELVDLYGVSLTVVVFALTEVIGVCWIYGEF